MCYNIAILKQGRCVDVGRIVYNNILEKLGEKGLTTYKIRKQKIIAESTLQHIRENKSITTDAIAKICEVLDCQPGDILRYEK
jgi:putative transcriptional regulator